MQLVLLQKVEDPWHSGVKWNTLRSIHQNKEKNKTKEFAETESEETDEDTQSAATPKKKKIFKDATLEAQTAHKEMCEQAKASMAMMNKVMKKLHDKLDDL